jgi:hypothetical protein
MIALRLHRHIYRGASVDEAVKIFTGYGTFERKEEPESWLVEVTTDDPQRERRIAGELANYALGLTVKAGGVDPKASAST